MGERGPGDPGVVCREHRPTLSDGHQAAGRAEGERVQVRDRVCGLLGPGAAAQGPRKDRARLCDQPEAAGPGGDRGGPPRGRRRRVVLPGLAAVARHGDVAALGGRPAVQPVGEREPDEVVGRRAVEVRVQPVLASIQRAQQVAVVAARPRVGAVDGGHRPEIVRGGRRLSGPRLAAVGGREDEARLADRPAAQRGREVDGVEVPGHAGSHGRPGPAAVGRAHDLPAPADGDAEVSRRERDPSQRCAGPAALLLPRGAAVRGRHDGAAVADRPTAARVGEVDRLEVRALGLRRQPVPLRAGADERVRRPGARQQRQEECQQRRCGERGLEACCRDRTCGDRCGYSP